MELVETLSALCRSCGSCCDGSLFELVVPSEGDLFEVRQPCEFLAELSCQRYLERPRSCRKFACGVLASYADGNISAEEAGDAVREFREVVSELSARLRGEPGKALARRIYESEPDLMLRARKGESQAVDTLFLVARYRENRLRFIGSSDWNG